MQSFCRTCLRQTIDNTRVSLNLKNSYQQLTFCIPELDLQALPDAKLCKDCHTLVDTFYKFKMKCLDVEKKIKEYQTLSSIVDLRDLPMWYSASVDNEIMIKQEEVDLANEKEIVEGLCEPITNINFPSIQNEQQMCSNLKVLSSTSKKNLKFSKYECGSIIQKHQLNRRIGTRSREKKRKCSQCTDCDYMAPCKSNLKRGRRKTEKQLFNCSECEYSTATKSILNRHARIHTDEKPFKCFYCPYNSARKADLRTHIRTHTGEKPYKCSQCDYTVARKSGLKQHMYSHTNEKPFKCLYCDYSTTRNIDLRQHMCTHTGERPFHCTQCEYNTARKSNLKHHMFSHTGDKPFKCIQCDYSTSRKFDLNLHFRTHIVESNLGAYTIPMELYKIHV